MTARVPWQRAAAARPPPALAPAAAARPPPALAPAAADPPPPALAPAAATPPTPTLSAAARSRIRSGLTPADPNRPGKIARRGRPAGGDRLAPEAGVVAA